ncbi:Eco57I restriction-modification methylase domain-containing protein [Tissierella praeacuta]|uniref:Eco57I restriction-modification methylase domain-containing protein n=1 Tax=Tissierella praeacuta TaxID=43131 RepID=UPI003513D313
MTRNELITLFEESQQKYSSTKSRDFLKESSQFFTPLAIAYKMIKTIDLSIIRNLDNIKILEPAAGCGILVLTSILYLIDNTEIKNIEVVAYEIDQEIFDVLNKNLKLLDSYVKDNTKINLIIKTKNKNFILDHSNQWNDKNFNGLYNIIISNPPFNKINQNSKEAIAMKDIVYGQPNIYTLFIGMCLKLLAMDGIYTVISPRNYLSGEYSKKLRNYIFTGFALSHIHSFDNRNIFKLVNQEIIISTYVNNQHQGKIKISHNGRFELQTHLNDIIYDNDTLSIIIPNSDYSISILQKFRELKYSLGDLGLKVSVGPVVQFRNQEFLSRKIYFNDFAPLLIANDIQSNNKIEYNNRINNPKRKTHNKSININSKNLVLNSNYLILRKITAKDDINTIITAVLEKDFLKHDFLGLDNNLLYFHKLYKNESLDLNECYGLYCYINSTYFEEYYLLINGTHTINVSDFDNIKLPDLETIKSMGDELISIGKFDKIMCSNIMDKFLFN